MTHFNSSNGKEVWSTPASTSKVDAKNWSSTLPPIKIEDFNKDWATSSLPTTPSSPKIVEITDTILELPFNDSSSNTATPKAVNLKLTTDDLVSSASGPWLNNIETPVRDRLYNSLTSSETKIDPEVANKTAELINEVYKSNSGSARHKILNTLTEEITNNSGIEVYVTTPTTASNSEASSTSSSPLTSTFDKDLLHSKYFKRTNFEQNLKRKGLDVFTDPE